MEERFTYSNTLFTIHANSDVTGNNYVTKVKGISSDYVTKVTDVSPSCHDADGNVEDPSENWQEFISNTTFHGVRYIFLEGSFLRR